MKMRRVELFLEHFMFGSRWLLVPFYLGLIAGIALLLVKFSKAFVTLVPVVFTGDGGAALLGILTLVDITLVANLLLIIIFAGYENFVSKIDTGDNEDRPEWMGHVGFSDLKPVSYTHLDVYKRQHYRRLSNQYGQCHGDE